MVVLEVRLFTALTGLGVYIDGSDDMIILFSWAIFCIRSLG